MNQELTTRDLAVLYVIVDHLQKETRRLEKEGYPQLSRMALGRSVDITLLWGNKSDPEKGILNQFIAEHNMGKIARHAEIIYRSIDKLQENGLIFDKTISPHQFAPTAAGIHLYEELKRKGEPQNWPEKLPVSASVANWRNAKYPYSSHVAAYS